jgi:hypothetical protein
VYEPSQELEGFRVADIELDARTRPTVLLLPPADARLRDARRFVASVDLTGTASLLDRSVDPPRFRRWDLARVEAPDPCVD